ncbi:hypothetical protein D5272_01725 [bacterium D16-76]|nr:hypothetical protein [bacterium D16-76]
MKIVYTLAKFVRDAKAGMSLELIWRYGKTGDDIDERLRGVREVTRVSSYKMEMTNAQGQESFLHFGSAKLVEYDDEYLTVYNPIRRELTEDERRVLDKIDSTDMFFLKKEYARKSSCPWIDPYGNKTIKGKRYISYENKVLDYSMRGEMILKYRIIQVSK